MFLIDADNVVEYLRQAGRIGIGQPAQARELGWGVSNVVVRVDWNGQSMVLKQSRPKLRTKADWYSGIDRIFREVDVLELLANRLPAGSIPTVLFQDRPNWLFAMSAVAPHLVWKEVLLNGAVDIGIAANAGDLLGRIHASTARDPQTARQFEDRTNFIELRVEPFYRRLLPRYPQFQTTIHAVELEMQACRECLVHADFSPKNILLLPEQITLVDFETGHWGDPAFDLGFFLSHIALKGLRSAQGPGKFLELIRVFLERYQQTLGRILNNEDIMLRAVRHFGLCALARVDGASPVDYLSSESLRNSARSMAVSILTQGPSNWSDIQVIIRQHAT